MKRFVIAALLVVACRPTAPAERYGFITRIGRDTVAVESITRQGRTVTFDAVDRFPRVRRRHTEIELDTAGGIRHLAMDIHTPSEPVKERERHVVADVTADSVIVTKKDDSATVRRAFATEGGQAMAHVPMSYALYELYFQAALRRRPATTTAGAPVPMRQFYIDREFDRFPLHRGVVRRTGAGRAEIAHDWLSGSGDATFDSAGHMLGYSGARSTYDVRVERLATPPDVGTLAAAFEAAESKQGGVRQLSVRDTVRASLGAATFMVDYGRPLARGRTLLGDVLPYDRIWRTGANAATQLTTSAPVSLGGLQLAAGTYTLWTVPHADGSAELIVNTQFGQWGTEYDAARDLGRATLATETSATPVEEFTIAIVASDAARGTLALAWRSFRWTAPIVVR
jgi:Protein of unknown function (DUF2911)